MILLSLSILELPLSRNDGSSHLAPVNSCDFQEWFLDLKFILNSSPLVIARERVMP